MIDSFNQKKLSRKRSIVIIYFLLWINGLVEKNSQLVNISWLVLDSMEIKYNVFYYSLISVVENILINRLIL
ncbi:hypothetical protein HMPREF9243_0128 [Aerococcus sp. Group 1]|nr:hypothetical protein HMPREF9243_0128 [Aerococcus sp. Group 1]